MKKTIVWILCALLAVSAWISCALAAEQTALPEETASKSGTLVEIDLDNSRITLNVMDGGNMGPGSGNQPPEMPSSSGNQPPEIPSGSGNQPPEMPSGSGNRPPEMPGNGGGAPGNMQPFGGTETKTYTVTDSTVITDADGNPIGISGLKQNDTVTFTADGEALLTVVVTRNMQGGMMPGGGSSAPTEYSSATHYTEDTSENSITQISTGKDESIVWVSDGATVSLSDITAERKSSDSTGGDNASFYGVGAAYLVTDGVLNISGSTISTDAAGGAGVFAYGSGIANVSDCIIKTEQGTSGGIHVAGGGTLHAENLSVETYGASSAAIRSDRGSGVMTVNGGTYISNGSGSPAVYSTADITVSDAVLTGANSEAVCIEGKNSLKLKNCDVTCNMPENEQNDCTWSVILYQSMSGDSEIGNSDFEMTGGSFKSYAGGLFYTTNTSSSFTLDSVEIITTDTPDFFLKCTGNRNKRGWGQSGNNGASCTFTAIGQRMTGDILWDSISTLNLSLKDGSVLWGAVIDDETSAGSGGEGYANLTIDGSSKWIVTGNSSLTALTCSTEIADDNGYAVTITGTDGTVYARGDSPYTVTVCSYNA